MWQAFKYPQSAIPYGGILWLRGWTCHAHRAQLREAMYFLVPKWPRDSTILVDLCTDLWPVSGPSTNVCPARDDDN